MFDFSAKQLTSIAKIDNPFQPVGHAGAVIKYRDNGDIYIAVEGTGVIEEYNEMTGGFDYTDLEGNELAHIDAMEVISGLVA